MIRWHRGVDDYEGVARTGPDRGYVVARVWRTTHRWAWTAYTGPEPYLNGVAPTFRAAKAAAERDLTSLVTDHGKYNRLPDGTLVMRTAAPGEVL